MRYPTNHLDGTATGDEATQTFESYKSEEGKRRLEFGALLVSANTLVAIYVFRFMKTLA
jgi:hypothetical protein